MKSGLECLANDGVIILDDSNRYEETTAFLEEGEFRKLVFKGLKPNGHSVYESTIFYRDDNCLNI